MGCVRLNLEVGTGQAFYMVHGSSSSLDINLLDLLCIHSLCSSVTLFIFFYDKN